MAVTFADAEGAVRGWVNTRAGLVGAGTPLAKGAMLNRVRGAATACYALISQVGGSPDLSAESPDQRARISASIYGPTKDSALTAAVAYAEALVTGLAGTAVTVPGALLLVADNITGPLWSPDVDEPRYIVDADIWLRPA